MKLSQKLEVGALVQVAAVSHDCSVVLNHSKEEMSLLFYRQNTVYIM